METIDKLVKFSIDHPVIWYGGLFVFGVILGIII